MSCKPSHSSKCPGYLYYNQSTAEEPSRTFLGLPEHFTSDKVTHQQRFNDHHVRARTCSLDPTQRTPSRRSAQTPTLRTTRAGERVENASSTSTRASNRVWRRSHTVSRLSNAWICIQNRNAVRRTTERKDGRSTEV